jgi:5'-nucleotidase/UDP-sugar diphosphatase
MPGNTRKFTILHSNDMHGDFLAEVVSGAEGKLVGGLSLLSGYIAKVRREEENVLYAIAGDMVQGSVIDSEYKGISTMEIMNYLAPDVVTLGNHEFDYGLPHLLFLEKIANFPIVNANLYIRKSNKRLMRPYHIIKMAGLEILFIGVITDKVIDAIQLDHDIGSFVSLEEASKEIGKIIEAYKNDDIDLTVLLTHIGFDSDCELAAMLNPAWGVDMIIGGHSHTILEQPAVVNNILIAQAGVGTNQVGRWDIHVDDDTNAIADWKWQLIPIEQGIAEPDAQLEAHINSFKQVVDEKYNSIVTRLAIEHTHPAREVETALGNLLADVLAEAARVDVMLLGSGSVRSKALGPIVTLSDFISCFPYSDSLTLYAVKGSTLRRMFERWMRAENRTGEGECYQVSTGVKVTYSESQKRVTWLSVKGEPVQAERIYTVGLQGYHASNSKAYLDVTAEDLASVYRPKVLSSNIQTVLMDYLQENQNLRRSVEGRIVYQQ